MNTWITAYSRALHAHGVCLAHYRYYRNTAGADLWHRYIVEWARRCRQYRAAMGGAL